MGDFFLPQMEDSFSLGVCFDIRKEGEGGAPGQRSPFCERQLALPLPRFSPRGSPHSG
jgi:hypothetical protein